MNFPHMNIGCFIIMKQATIFQLTIYYVLENSNSQMLVNLVAPKQKIKDQIFNVNQKHKLYVWVCVCAIKCKLMNINNWSKAQRQGRTNFS